MLKENSYWLWLVKTFNFQFPSFVHNYLFLESRDLAREMLWLHVVC